MAFTYFARDAEIQQYLCSLGRLPRDYVASQGDTVTFRWRDRDEGIAPTFCSGASRWPVYSITSRSTYDPKWALIEALNRDMALQAGTSWSQPPRTTRIKPTSPKPIPATREEAIALTTPRVQPAGTVETPANITVSSVPAPSEAPVSAPQQIAAILPMPSGYGAQQTKVNTMNGTIVGPSIYPAQLPASQQAPYAYSGQAPSQGLLGAVLGGVGGFITGGPAGAVLGAIGGYTAGGETPSSPGTTIPGYTGTSLVSGCPTGYKWNGSQCVQTGVGGAIAQILPGGSTGVLPQGMGQAVGEAVMGRYGPALAPFQVGSVTRSDGSTGPILRCLPGMVLGRDDLCYNKGQKGLQRKWKPGARPLLTGGEVRTLRKIHTLQNRVKKAWHEAGKPGYRPCTKKTTRRK